LIVEFFPVVYSGKQPELIATVGAGEKLTKFPESYLTIHKLFN